MIRVIVVDSFYLNRTNIRGSIIEDVINDFDMKVMFYKHKSLILYDDNEVDENVIETLKEDLIK